MPPKTPPKAPLITEDGKVVIDQCLISVKVEADCSSSLYESSFSDSHAYYDSPTMERKSHFDYVDILCDGELIYEGTPKIGAKRLDSYMDEGNV